MVASGTAVDVSTFHLQQMVGVSGIRTPSGGLLLAIVVEGSWNFWKASYRSGWNPQRQGTCWLAGQNSEPDKKNQRFSRPNTPCVHETDAIASTSCVTAFSRVLLQPCLTGNFSSPRERLS
ncbi:hypothetical protein AVEN_89946-1 [Araneus ventricosus]|uniref:Uncharacterized protein n=1 Tax=Araneus ventricosus TaxID=182803 RepID=A0A4Y2N393_ARAVE|nr:hypothetical protein AVEN_89946-1 [Araneus ventricosus]